MRKQKATKTSSKKKLAQIRLRRAQGAGLCTRCGGAYTRGQMLAGATGSWFHEFHLTDSQRAKAWKIRVGGQTGAGRPLSVGGFETSRRRH